jgi:hypothetical protein
MHSILLAILLISAAALSKEVPKPTQDARVTFPQITITTALSQDSTVKGKQVDFSGTIVNDSNQTIKHVTIISIIPHEYSILRICRQNAIEPCEAPSGNTLSGDIVDQVSPGERLAFWGSLKADSPHSKTRINFVIQYLTGTGTSSIISFAGFNAVRTGWESFWSSAYSGLKDLALPIVLAFLGVGLNIVTNRRDRKLLEQDREKTLRSETWGQILPVSHKLACRYYIPLCSAAWGTSMAWDAFLAAGQDLRGREEQARRFFFYILQFGLMMRDIKNAMGGFYFKERFGEKIAGSLWKNIRDFFPGKREDELRDYFGSLKHINRKDDLDTFLKKFDSKEDPAHATLQLLFSRLKLVLADEQKTAENIRFLDVMRKIVVCEANRIYDYWYVVKERLLLSTDEENIVLTLFSDAAEQSEARAYLKTARRDT